MGSDLYICSHIFGFHLEFDSKPSRFYYSYLVHMYPKMVRFCEFSNCCRSLFMLSENKKLNEEELVKFQPFPF